MGIQNGSKVQIHYTLTVESKVVESSKGRDPLSFTQGQGEIILGLESGLMGHKLGDKFKVTVSPDQAYGVRSPQAVQKVPRTAFQDSTGLKKGDVVSGQGAGGRPIQAMIVEITSTEVTLDLNHPLADKTLTFDVEVVGVE